MPFVARLRAATLPLIGALLAEFAAPLADGLVGDDDAADKEEFFHSTVAQRKAEVPPDGVADDLSRKPMMLIQIGRG